jgi:hypothetical protein
MALSIPNRYVSALMAIRHLPESAIAELVEALASASINSRPEGMCSAIKDKVPSVPENQLESVVDALYALYNVREYSEMNRNSFLRELIAAIEDSAEEKFSESESGALRTRLRKLLNIDSLDSLSKAVRLQRTEERVYCRASIVSDIRPVFGANVGEKPLAAVIMHKLELGFHGDGEHHEFSVLASQWNEQTQYLSIGAKAVSHPAYFEIVAMGPKVIPLVLEELRDRPSQWFVALRALAKIDPVPPNANRSEAREAWLRWGLQNGYIS